MTQGDDSTTARGREDEVGRFGGWSWDLPPEAPPAGDVAERLDRP